MTRSLIIIGIICTCLLSCSKNGLEQAGTSGVQTDDGANAYLTISLSLPQTMETKSQTNQEGGTTEGTENALATESKVTDAWLILGELAEGQQAPIKISHKYYIDKFQYAGNPAQWIATIKCHPGRYRIALIVNPSQKISFNSLPHSDWDALARYVMRFSSYQEIQEIWSDGHFLMTNAYHGMNDENNVQMSSGKHSYKDIYVQRACARFDYHVERQDNTYNVNCIIDGAQTTIPVELTEAGMINISNNFNLFKMVVPDNQPGRVPNFYQFETSDNYVYDSDWEEKRYFQTPIFEDWRLKEFFFFPSERKVADPQAPEKIIYKLLDKTQGKESIFAYASENTLPGVLAQINKLSTGVVFKGKFSLNTQTSTVYYRALSNGTNELYTSVDNLKNKLNSEGYIVPMQEPTDSEWAKLGVRKFTKGSDGTFPVWYTYWNRHNDNGRPQEMGIMEFAVVRNNVYKLGVRSISSLGLPLAPDDPQNPWKPGGNTPDEQLSQINVTVEVSNWVEREFVHEI